MGKRPKCTLALSCVCSSSACALALLRSRPAVESTCNAWMRRAATISASAACARALACPVCVAWLVPVSQST